MASKRAGRMTMVPQFTVPEIFVDDEAAHGPDMSPAAFDGYDYGLGPPSSGPSSGTSSPRVAKARVVAWDMATRSVGIMPLELTRLSRREGGREPGVVLVRRMCSMCWIIVLGERAFERAFL